MPYTINFSDPTKLDTISVPDMPPGINTVDTSLSLVGRGYPNYGQKIAENFVHLLENFASPIPPQNPIEGQLWYDTSDPNNKVLRIMDGTATATRWPNANGIYQQGTDPRDSATQGLKIGDIWVDTASNQLKIYNSNDWTSVGPSTIGLEKTGPEPATILDTNNNEQYIIKNWVEGQVLSIVAYKQFSPKSVINGFSLIRPGINLSNAPFTGQPAPIFNGTALRARNLLDSNNNSFPSDTFLRKSDQSQYGQIIDGVIRFLTPSINTTLTGQGRDGIVIINGTTTSDTNYVQFYKGDNDAIVLNNTANGKIIFKVKGTVLSTVLELSTEQLSLTGSANITKNLTVANTLTVLSTASAAVVISGGTSIAKNLSVAGNSSVAGATTLTGTITVGADIIPSNNGTQYLGSFSKKFRQIYADIVGTTGSVFVGTFNGLARGLQQSTEFKIQGQVTGTSVLYNGTSTTATFVTQLMPSSISDQPLITTSTSSLSILVLNTVTSALSQIKRDDFLSSVFPTGMIMAYGTNTNIPTGWILCNGDEYVQTGTYTNLYSLIGSNYGSATAGYFKVPDMRKSTTATNSTIFVSYIIKT